jgi:hypothetical protein
MNQEPEVTFKVADFQLPDDENFSRPSVWNRDGMPATK